MSDLVKLAKLVDKMRRRQERYFNHRDHGALGEAIKLEKQVDAEVAKILEGYKGDLFSEIEG